MSRVWFCQCHLMLADFLFLKFIDLSFVCVHGRKSENMEITNRIASHHIIKFLKQQRRSHSTNFLWSHSFLFFFPICGYFVTHVSSVYRKRHWPCRPFCSSKKIIFRHLLTVDNVPNEVAFLSCVGYRSKMVINRHRKYL